MQRLPAPQVQGMLSEMSDDVLKHILALVPGIDTLILRSELALVSRSFASAVKDLSAVTISDSNLPGTSLVLSQAAKAHFSNILGGVQHLHLSTAKATGYGRMFGVTRCCPALQTLTISLHSVHWAKQRLSHASTIEKLAEELWPLLTQHSAELPQLCKLTVSDGHGQVLLHAGAAEGGLAGVANVLEGHLVLLESLIVIGIKPEYENVHMLHRTMLEVMPSLHCISGVGSDLIRTYPTRRRVCHTLEAPFKGRVSGILGEETLDTFRQASIAHSRGLRRFIENEQLPVLNAIRSCKGTVLHHNQAFAECVPRLEVLQIRRLKIFGPPDEPMEVFFTPCLTSIDVCCFVGDVLLVHGLASQQLMHLRLVASVIIIERDLFDWLNARYAKALIISANAAGSRNESNQFVIKSSKKMNSGLPGIEVVSLFLNHAR